jgi:hypothetical protein
VTPNPASHSRSPVSPAIVARNVPSCTPSGGHLRRGAHRRHHVVAMHPGRRTARPLHPRVASFRDGRYLVARRRPPMMSLMFAHEAGQRSHRSPRHTHERARSHQAAPASVQATTNAGTLTPRRRPCPTAKDTYQMCGGRRWPGSLAGSRVDGADDPGVFHFFETANPP